MLPTSVEKKKAAQNQKKTLTFCPSVYPLSWASLAQTVLRGRFGDADGCAEAASDVGRMKVATAVQCQNAI